MKTLRVHRGPFNRRLYFTSEEIDEMCLNALGDFLPKIPQPIRIDRFIERHFKCPIIYETLPEDVLGCTAFNKEGSVKAVIISTTIDDGQIASERRIRSTLAHEAGHCLMHGSLFLEAQTPELFSPGNSATDNVDFRERKILCRQADIGAVSGQKIYDGRWWEWQANRAIGGFLVPKPLVQLLLTPMLKSALVTKSPCLPMANRKEAEQLMANTFEVNPVVARIRLMEMFPMRTGQLEF